VITTTNWSDIVFYMRVRVLAQRFVFVRYKRFKFYNRQDKTTDTVCKGSFVQTPPSSINISKAAVSVDLHVIYCYGLRHQHSTSIIRVYSITRNLFSSLGYTEYEVRDPTSPFKESPIDL